MDLAVFVGYLNTIACVLLMMYAVPVATAMAHRGKWLNRLTMWAACLALAMQSLQASPEWITMPRAQWPQALGNVVLLLWVTVWRRELMAFVRCKFGPPPRPSAHPNLGRRIDDIEKLSMHHVHGGSKQ